MAVTMRTDRARGAGPAPEASRRAARERLDAWVREVVAWHFSPETGSPFWLEHARKLSWDPRREVCGFADLERFEPFREEWLRGGPVSRWVPRGLAGRPVAVFERGSVPGAPQNRINIDDYQLDYAHFAASLPDEAFPPGADWLAVSSTGPRRQRLAVEHLAQVRGGISFLVDLDPRWFGKCLKQGWNEVAEAYKNHVIDQSLTILRAHPNIRCLYITPKLLEALCDKVSLHQVGITGVCCGGAPMPAAWHRHARAEFLQGVEFVPMYGNTLMGPAFSRPFVPEDDGEITYHAPQPRAVLQVVDSRNPEREVGYGERGRVRLTTLTKEFFVPGHLERDEAARAEPIELYPWDGVRDVRPFSGAGAS
jgi:hypothetical protein